MAPGVIVKRSLIFVHRWLGVALAALFLLWFPSGIAMMYWTYPSVSQSDRLERAAALDPATIALSPLEAYRRLNATGSPAVVHLNTFDGRPVYRFGGFQLVYADTGEEQREVPMAMVGRIAAGWTGQPVSAAAVEEITDVDQWTVQDPIENLAPLWKFSWPNGEQVYVSQSFGEVVQYTTPGSRLGAYVGAIPHWFYFTPLRKQGAEWSRLVIWSSGIGAITVLLGMVIGLWMYSPTRKYRSDGVPTSIPYRGQKRWHMVFGLLFGTGAVTWAFSGMLSMDPFPERTNRPEPGAPQIGRGGGLPTTPIPDALRGEQPPLETFTRHPTEVLRALGTVDVKDLELIAFDGEPVYLATLAGGETRIVPVRGDPMPAFETDAIVDVVKRAAGESLAEVRTLDQYDRYYLDRTRRRPLPVILARLDDGDETRYYIDPRTATVVGDYRASDWMSRWAYHGLHSLDFPWLYNYRPLWDIVVITFMVGGTALCVTSLVLAWRVLGRTLRLLVPQVSNGGVLDEDLAR